PRFATLTALKGAVVTDLIRVPIAGTEVLAAEIGGKPHIILRPAIENLGLAYGAQFSKLKGKSWATVSEIETVGADGKNRLMTAVPVRTFLMLLATVSENKVRPELRPLLATYQAEVADAIE